MSPLWPNVARGGFVLLDPDSGRVQRVMPFQYNPDTLTRKLTPKGMKEETGDRLEALRLTGPPTETLSFDAEFDATDQLASPGQHAPVAENGLYPVLAALETSFTPPTSQLRHEDSMASSGIVEVLPAEAPLLLLVMGQRRVLPVRITDYSVTEEGYDSFLNPIRAKVSLGVRVLTVDDFGFTHRGGLLYMGHQQRKESLASLASGGLADLGLNAIPGV